MKVLVIYRKFIPGRLSIEKVFENVYTNFKEIEHQSYTYVSLPKFLIFLIKNIKKFDVVHITGDVNYLSIFTFLFCPTVNTIHDFGSIKNLSNSNKKIIKFFKRLVFKFLWIDIPYYTSSKITVGSLAVINDFVTLGYSSEKISRVGHPSYSNVKKISEYSTKINKLQVLIIGTGKHKNIDRSIEACKSILGIELIIIGSLDKDLLKKLNGIKYTNYFDISDKEIEKKYFESDILLFPSLHEGFGLPILEANTIGLPVITSHIAPCTEVASNAAYYVDPDDSFEIKNAIINLMNGSELKRKLVSNGFVNSNKFSRDKIQGLYLNIFKSVV
ncbi:glycosyltransferase [Verrucomicrobiales bacterium]|nr:glycosyltransferase [Verrucomicrobiales bacterium]